MKNFVLGIIAGALVGIGGTVYLASESKIIGSVLFTFGLFFVLVYQFKLYTGLIGYALSNNKKANLALIPILIGNWIGAMAVGFLLRLTRLLTILESKAITLTDTKLNDTWYSVLILAFFCGLLMYLAVNTYYKGKTELRLFGLVLAITVFALIGFEHSIANIYYYSFANVWSLKTVLYVIIAIIGNGLGSLLIPTINILVKKEDI